MIIMETKVGDESAKGIADRLPFDGAIFANSIGLSGGLWLLWDLSQVDVADLSSIEQEIHVVVTPSYSNNPWLSLAVYASPRYAKRCLLWENLEAVSELHFLSWVITSDINEVLMGDDKFRGRPVNVSRALQFQDCLDLCRMIDIGLSGARFTKSNHRPMAYLIQERIDRVFVNADWNGLYLEACVKHLKRSHSDHSPIMMCLDNNHSLMLPRPFRFQPIWLLHPSFLDVVREAWTRLDVMS